MAATKSTNSPSALQSIEQLQQRYNALHRQQIQAETNLKNAQRQLDSLRAEAREKYQTDDLDVLRQKLADMKEENDRKRREYQDKLDKIEADLAEVEESFAGGETVGSR